jgi:hypothetical protein
MLRLVTLHLDIIPLWRLHHGNILPGELFLQIIGQILVGAKTPDKEYKLKLNVSPGRLYLYIIPCRRFDTPYLSLYETQNLRKNRLENPFDVVPKPQSVPVIAEQLPRKC